MTERDAPSQTIDAGEIRAAAAALAAHLQRSGVHWLPRPRPPVVDELNQWFTPTDAVPIDPVPRSETADRIQPSSAHRPPSIRPAARLDPLPDTTADGLLASGDDAYEGPAIDPSQRPAALEQIQNEVRGCTRCEILASCRKQTVFGEGSAAPRVAFFGEGPGADEDRSGRPFVGRAGQLLTKMIEACKFRREDVYIFNTVKCRPPGNRNPEADEIANCREYYQRQLAVLRPEYIVCLGAVSAQELLSSKLSVGRLRGKLHRYFESKVLVTYHPAYLLRNPAAKKAAWADLQLLLRDAGIQI